MSTFPLIKYAFLRRVITLLKQCVVNLGVYLDQIDPYYTQRIILRKGLYAATLLTLVYWLFLPVNYLAYMTTPILVSYVYELPFFASYANKEKALVVAFLIAATSSVLFYLSSPHPVLASFVMVAYFVVVNFMRLRYFREFQPSMLLSAISVGVVNMMVLPSATLSVAYDMVFCNILALLVMLFAFKTHSNLYALVWQRACYLYIHYLTSRLNALIEQTPNTKLYPIGVKHLNIIRFYRGLLPRVLLRNVLQTNTALRNINVVINYLELDFIHYPQPQIWLHFIADLQKLAYAVKVGKQCNCWHTPDEQTTHNNASQDNVHYSYAYYNFTQAMIAWNKLCIKI